MSLNARGFGFITGEDGHSYFLRANLARFVLTGDDVRFIPQEAGEGDSREVRALVSISRKPLRMLCEVQKVAGLVLLVADDPCFLPLQLDEANISCQIAQGDVVAVRLQAYEGTPVVRPLIATVESNLGPRSRAGFDEDYARVRFSFDAPIPDVLLNPSSAATPEFEEFQTNFDPFVTIDGESTRDIDDAVFACGRPDGGWAVKVAIADVSWYVSRGSELDSWAGKRCTSLYLPGNTFPMLPDWLSADRCSLVADKVRRAVVMSFILDEKGEVVYSSLQRSYIKSVARLTYDQVADFMAGKPEARFAGEVENSLQALTEVYAVLAEKRAQAGRLDFDEPEPTMVQGSDGNWTLQWVSRNEAHKLIEEMMLLANQNAAAMLMQRYGAGLFRHQPPPDEQSWAELKNWAHTKSHALPDIPCLRAMSDLVVAQQTAEEQAAAVLKVRMSMQPARYVALQGHEINGHFSLSVPWYTHFTSPIRRYADLLVHRLLLAPPEFKLDGDGWAQLLTHVAACSERAQAARLAERMVWDRLKLKAFCTAVDTNTAVPCRIVRNNQRGLRVVLTGWQCSAWLPSSDLRSQGYQWVDDQWVGPESELPRILTEGVQLPIVWTALSTERPAYPELQVRLSRS